MNTVSTIPTSWALLDEALRARRPIWVSYHRRRRLVWPHALGSRGARALVLAYQTGGETSTGDLDPDPRKRWRVLFVEEIDEVLAADPTSRWGTADNYNACRPFPVIDEVFSGVNFTGSRTFR